MRLVSSWSMAMCRCAAPVPIISVGSVNAAVDQVSSAVSLVSVIGSWVKDSGSAYSVPSGSGVGASRWRGRR